MGVGCRIRRFRIRRGSGTSTFQPGSSCSPPLLEGAPYCDTGKFWLGYFGLTQAHWATRIQDLWAAFGNTYHRFIPRWPGSGCTEIHAEFGGSNAAELSRGPSTFTQLFCMGCSHSLQSAGQAGELACRTSLEQLNLLGPQNLQPTSTSAPGNTKRQVAALCTCQGCLWSATKQICLPCTYPRRFEAILRCKASVNSRVRKT